MTTTTQHVLRRTPTAPLHGSPENCVFLASSLKPPHHLVTSQALCRLCSPYPSPCLGFCPPPPSFPSASSSSMLRLDSGVTAGRAGWCGWKGARRRGPRPTNPVIASLSRLPQSSFQTQNSSQPLPWPHLLGVVRNTQTVGSGRPLPDPQKPGWSGQEQGGVPLAPVPVGSAGRMRHQLDLLSPSRTPHFLTPRGVLAPATSSRWRVGALARMPPRGRGAWCS